MFPLFLQLPRDIRRMIWLATLGPMTLTFHTGKPPKDDEEYEDLTGIDLSFLTNEEVDYLCRRPLFANYTRYYGYVALADGSSRLSFTVKSSAAYLACKESRAFLRFIFAEPVRPGGGLPSWFRFDMDTVRFAEINVGIIANHPWFTQVQHLVVCIVFEILYYMGIFTDNIEETNGKNHIWVEKNLTSLKNVTFEMCLPYSYAAAGRPYDWLQPWWDIFETWYNCPYGSYPVPYFAQVISRQMPEEEWLTPANYLRVRKMILQKHVQYFAQPDDGEDGFHLERDWQGRKNYYILKAKDEELENAAEFFKKHRSIWQE